LSPEKGVAFHTTDGSNIIFEFTAFDISQNYTTKPTFEDISNVSGLNNVSAISQIDIPASLLNNLFYFETYADITNTIIPIKFGINTNFSFNLSYSNSSLRWGQINTNTSFLYADYVNYLAQAITGGYNTADIFANEAELNNAVAILDLSFNKTITANISNCSINHTDFSTMVNISERNIFFDVSDPTILTNLRTPNPYIVSCETLVNGLLSINNTSRGQRFISDISGQNLSSTNFSGGNVSNASTGFYTVRFHQGDLLSLRISYVPYGEDSGTTIIGENKVYTRSYKVVLNCKTEN